MNRFEKILWPGLLSFKICTLAISWHLIIIKRKTFFEQRVFKSTIFSLLPKHISNSNFYWMNALLQSNRNQPPLLQVMRWCSASARLWNLQDNCQFYQTFFRTFFNNYTNFYKVLHDNLRNRCANVPRPVHSWITVMSSLY